MSKYILKYCIGFIGTYLLSSFFELSVSFDSSKDFFNNMLVISTMVFTLMAIWIAYLYPEALNKIKAQENVEIADFTEAQDKLKRLEFIVASILKSAIVSIIIISIYLAKALFEQTNFILEHLPDIQLFLAPTLIVLFWLQSEAIISVMKANVTFINELHGRKEHKEEEEDI
jgi:hypothetical protein